MTDLEKQIEVLNISNYSIEDGKLVINGTLWLSNLKSIPDSNFLSNNTINGNLYIK